MHVYDLTVQHELFKREADSKTQLKFTTVQGKEQYVYCGTLAGSVCVYETSTGTFIKEIPLQYAAFNNLKLSKYKEPPVTQI